jgi:hypothetical protein
MANVGFRHLQSASCSRSQSPQPHAENDGHDQRDPAYAHWDRVRSDGDLRVIDQPHDMPNSENGENHAGYA